jgi:phosphoglycerate dehydrogenase-like enzyme
VNDRRPAVLLAHWQGIDLLGEPGRRRLATVAQLLDEEPVGAWDDPRAESLLSQAEVILGHWGCPFIDAGVLDRAPHLELIAYAAGTVKTTIDAVVFDRDVRVTSCADANAEPVAEFTLAAILFANKDVLWRRDRMRDSELRGFRQRSPVPVGNWRKTVGIIGASLVGRRVMDLLRSFPHLSIVLHDPFVSDADAAALGARKVDLDELCATSDIVSVHAPDLPTTRHMVGPVQLAAMRTGATLINTARGALVDHDALRAELASGRLYAILDVTDPEPLPDDDPLRTLPNAFVTPHLAGSEGTELERLAEGAVDEIERWLDGRPARNEVRRDQLDRLA